MKKLAAIAALSASAFGLSAGAAFADYTLNVLHFNDWHSRLESNNKFESTCSAEEEGKGECFGGAARLVTAIREARERLKDQNVVLLNAGDNFQGSLFYTTYKGEAERDILNQLGIDAMALGNHEFDDGEEALVPFIETAKFPILGVNVRPDNQSKANGKIKPSVVLDIGGQKIGVVGAVTTETPDIASPGPHIKIEDDVANITAEVKKLEAEGVNKIIALTHIGYPRDMEMIAKIPGVDVVVGGHTHTLLSNKADDKPAGPYPTMIDNPGGYKVPVTQAASYSKLLGDFQVVFDDNGVVKEAKGDPLWLDKNVTPDPAILEQVAKLAAPIEELKKQVVGETTTPIDGSRDTCRAKECEMGNLVSDAVLDHTKSQGVTIVFTNGGGLRASIDQGPVTMGEVLTVLPFQNTIATFQIKGEDAVAALENGVSQLEDGAGRFAQVAGMKYSFDGTKPVGSRVSDVQVQEGDNWVPIDPAKTYIAATNNYVRGGGDGYKIFAEKATNAYDFGPGLEKTLADYLTAHNPYTPKLEGRITVIAEAPKKAPEAAAPAPASAAPAPAATEAPKPAETTAAPAAEAPKPAEPAAEAAAPPLPEGSNEIATTPPVVEPAPAAPAAEAPAAPQTATAPAEAPAAAPAATTDYVIKRGDTYWWLARRLLGKHSRWQELEAANPDYKATDLPVGGTLKVPG